MAKPIFTCKKALIADVKKRGWENSYLSVSKIDSGFIDFCKTNSLGNLVNVTLQLKTLEEFLDLDITEDTTLEELLETPFALCFRTMVNGEETIYFDSTDNV